VCVYTSFTHSPFFFLPHYTTHSYTCMDSVISGKAKRKKNHFDSIQYISIIKKDFASVLNLFARIRGKCLMVENQTTLFNCLNINHSIFYWQKKKDIIDFDEGNAFFFLVVYSAASHCVRFLFFLSNLSTKFFSDRKENDENR